MSSDCMQEIMARMPRDIAREMEDLQRLINSTKLELDSDIYEKSTITRFFQGKCVFLTGGAGFLGQVYIEKLLR